MRSIALEVSETQALYQRIEQLEIALSISQGQVRQAVKEKEQAVKEKEQAVKEKEQAVKEKEQAIERDNRSSARAEQYRQELQYRDEVAAVPFTTLSASQKLTMMATRNVVKELRVDPYTETVIHLNRIAETIGVSDDTVRLNLKYFTKHAPDVLTYRFERNKLTDDFGRVVIGPDKKPVFRTTSYVTLKPLIESPSEIVADVPRKQGGNRKCKVCGSEDLEVVRRVRCRHCNNVEWDWPTDSDMGAAPPEQESVYVVPIPEIVEVPTEVSISLQEATASVTVVDAPICA